MEYLAAHHIRESLIAGRLRPHGHHLGAMTQWGLTMYGQLCRKADKPGQDESPGIAGALSTFNI